MCVCGLFIVCCLVVCPESVGASACLGSDADHLADAIVAALLDSEDERPVVTGANSDLTGLVVLLASDQKRCGHRRYATTATVDVTSGHTMF